MKKFTKVVESNQTNTYLVEAKVLLEIEAENEGDAGYTADSILGSVEGLHNFTIEDISDKK
jgi:hypothetical protein